MVTEVTLPKLPVNDDFNEIKTNQKMKKQKLVKKNKLDTKVFTPTDRDANQAIRQTFTKKATTPADVVELNSNNKRSAAGKIKKDKNHQEINLARIGRKLMSTDHANE